MTRHVVPPAAAVPAAPAMFRVRMRVLTPLELEKERLGSADFIPHFRGREFRLLWGDESVIEDFSSAPVEVRRDYDAGSSSAISIPRAYYGTLTGDGSLSQDVVDTRSGASVLEIGEYRRTLTPHISAALWALDHRAERHHFHPCLRISLRRFEPPVVPEASRQVELWWRLWNLGQIDTFDIHPAQPAAEEAAPEGDHSEPEGRTVYELGPGRTFARANAIARARWDHVRTLLQGGPTSTDAAFLNDLLLHHDRQDPQP